ncbi:dipeptidase PepV [Halalkalibacterium halodurans]|uniref:dipeptidase PepV n=2 Tax=Halalkalibacterium halodurans TaxID=86665 RepID=UPI0010674FB6|nr:dipeptidase PepV [Halalkalibacterium halodurans]TES54380.1 dipeptidase PepV [Halalkalibacterium halodurans]
MSDKMEINWLKEVKNRRDEIVYELREFLQYDSVYDEKTRKAGAPFGTKIEAALLHLLNLGKKANFSVKNLEGYAGYIEMGQGEESVGILCHIDVVPPGEGWSSPPFAAEIQNDRIVARGALDDKGPTIAAFFAMRIIHELNLSIKRRVRLIIGTDEERNWECVDFYFRHEEMPTVGIVPDADFPIIVAEKGVLDVEVSIPFHDTSEHPVRLQTFYAGERLNMVPDRAIASLICSHESTEAIKASFDHFIEEHQLEGKAKAENGLLMLTLEGKSAHGSTPEKGINAAVKLAQFLHHVDGLSDPFIQFISEHLRETNGAGLSIACSDDVSGPLTINAGRFAYTYGETGTIGVNIRYPVTVDVETFLAGLQAHNHRIMNHLKPSYVEKDHPLIRTLQTVYKRQTGEEATLLAIGGGTYARALKTGVAFGPLFPGEEDTAHQKDESISIDQLLRATALYAEAIYELASQ